MKLTNSYIAGFFDGEGCVSLFYGTRRKWKSDPTRNVMGLRLVVTVSNTDRSVLDGIAARFGGGVHRSHTDKPAHYRDSYAWRLNTFGEQRRFLRAIRSHAIVKSEQIGIALHYLETAVAPGCRVGQKQWDVRLACYEAMLRLNNRGGHEHLRAPPRTASKGNQMGRRPSADV